MVIFKFYYGTSRPPEVVMKIEELGGIEKVIIIMIKYSCNYGNDLTEILPDDISGDVSTYKYPKRRR